MKIYNTMTRAKEAFEPLDGKNVKIYGCGPTVYNYIHIGNARPLCVFDVLRRFLKYLGYNVTFAQNFTDIDDKIINKAIEENCDYTQVAEKYIAEYEKDAQGLNITKADIAPKATENIKSITDLISRLIVKGYAYTTKSGDVYFRTRKFKEYGRLSHQPIEDLEAGARIAVGEKKEDPLDFALWKAAKPGEPFWKASWGNGRPGWHIECSAMAQRYLGQTIDIHCGGQDLIFPHHENEIAQSESCNKAPFARYWMHNGYINVDNQKMSKSLNNFFTVRDVAEKYGYEPIRYLMIASHYRSPISYSTDVLEQCKAALERLYTFRENLEFFLDNSPEAENTETHENNLVNLEDYQAKFVSAMNDDLNTADALAVLFDMVRDVNTAISEKNCSKTYAAEALRLFNELVSILGLLYCEKKSDIDDEIKELIAKRSEARQNKDWETADKIRDELKARKVIVEDTPQGVKWRVLG